MGRITNEERMKRAVANGDIALAQKLLGLLDRKPKAKSKPKPKKVREKAANHVVVDEVVNRGDESSFIARTRREGDAEKNYGRKEQFKPVKNRVNQFDKLIKEVESDIEVVKAAQWDKHVKKKKLEIQRKEPPRPPAKKVKATCTACGKSFMVAPELGPRRVGEEMMRWFCNTCLPGRKQ